MRGGDLKTRVKTHPRRIPHFTVARRDLGSGIGAAAAARFPGWSRLAAAGAGTAHGLIDDVLRDLG